MNPLLHAISTLSAAMAGSLVSAICGEPYWSFALPYACIFFLNSVRPHDGSFGQVFLLLLLHFFPSMDSHLESGSVFQASPFHLDPLWSVAIASVWMVLSLWRGAQFIRAPSIFEDWRCGRLAFNQKIPY